MEEQSTCLHSSTDNISSSSNPNIEPGLIPQACNKNSEEQIIQCGNKNSESHVEGGTAVEDTIDGTLPACQLDELEKVASATSKGILSPEDIANDNHPSASSKPLDDDITDNIKSQDVQESDDSEPMEVDDFDRSNQTVSTDNPHKDLNSKDDISCTSAEETVSKTVVVQQFDKSDENQTRDSDAVALHDDSKNAENVELPKVIEAKANETISQTSQIETGNDNLAADKMKKPVVKDHSIQPHVFSKTTSFNLHTQTKKRKSISRGIGFQWTNNSCYIDSTLFSMFYQHNYFDSIFVDNNMDWFSEEPNSVARDILDKLKMIAEELKDKNGFCPTSWVQYLRGQLSRFNDEMNAEMLDVTSLLDVLFRRALKLKNFIQYDRPKSGNIYYQIWPPPKYLKDPHHQPVLSTLLQDSLRNQSLKLNEMPLPAFIIKMPRSNGELVGCTGVIPDLQLDIKPLLTDPTFKGRTKMNLAAVICLEGLHYTAYVRFRNGSAFEWVNFNDMGPMLKEEPKLEMVLQLWTAKKKIVHETATFLVENAHVCIYYPSDSA